MRFNRQNKKSHWDQDCLLESYVHNFLEANKVYEKMDAKEYIEDKERQILGIDIISEKFHNIDEKACACQLPTFCLELSGHIRSLQDAINSGWLFKTHSLTDHIVLEWATIQHPTGSIQGDKEAIILENGKNIVSVELVVINVAEIQRYVLNYFEQDELTEEFLQKIRAFKTYGERKRFLVQAGEVVELTDKLKKEEQPFMWLCVSGQLAESPINVVVSKKFLTTIALTHWLVTKEGVMDVRTRKLI